MKITLKETAAKLKAAERILLTAHVNPDGDAIGSTLALMQVLKKLGKFVQIYIDDEIPRNFKVMPFEEDIRRPRTDEIFKADLLVVLDTSTDRIGDVRKLTDAPILNIDHHVTNKGDDGDIYVQPDAAATCEIIFDLANELGVELDKNIAVCLYTGLATDTGFFNYSNTHPSTFRAAAALVEAGVEPNVIAEQMEKRTIRDAKVMTTALQTARLFYRNRVVGMFIDEELYREVDTTEGLIDLIRVIETAEVAFLLTCRGENVCRVSMRSKNVNVAEIAHRLGGGGHIRAAGCTLNHNLDNSKFVLIRAIGEYMIEHGYLTPAEYDDKQDILLSEWTGDR